MSTGLRIAVLIKQVPKIHAAQFDDRGRLNRSVAQSEMNPYCRRALAHAVRLAAESAGTCIAITMGPAAAEDVLREAQACGADRTIHLCDRELAGSDSLVTSRALAAAIRSLGHIDLVLAGRSSVDAATAVVPSMVAEQLALPHVGPAMELTVTGHRKLRLRVQHDDADESVIVTGPAVITVAERSVSPARAVPEAWPQRLRGWRMAACDLGPGIWGQPASPTVVRALQNLRQSRAATIVDVSQAAELIASRLECGGLRALPLPVPESVRGHAEVAVLLDPFDDSGAVALLGEAAAIATALGGHVLAISGRQERWQLAAWGADAVLRPSGVEPRPLSAALTARLGSAATVLAPATPWAREVLARLAVRMHTGLIADATEIGVDASGTLVARKPAGDAYEAEIVCRPRPPLVTLRTGSLPLRSPRRVVLPVPDTHLTVGADSAIARLARTARDEADALDRAFAVLAVGRGVQPTDYPQLEPLRRLLGAELAASRPVTDSTALPRGRQVGITGRSVAPAIYLAVGISGSANHVSGIARAGTVVAVNCDPQAPIFGSADIGLVGDWHEILPALCAELALRLPD